MTKILKLSIITLLIISCNSCSSDDDTSEQSEQDYTITLESECGNADTRTKYCVTEEEVDNAFDNAPVGEPCYFTTITDIDGNSHSGILRSGGTGNCDDL